MPVDIEEFRDAPEEALEYGEGTQPRLVLAFLASNSNLAFTQSEIAEAIDIAPKSVGAVLTRLRERGLVDHRGKFWAIGEDDRLAALASQETASSASVTDDFYGQR